MLSCNFLFDSRGVRSWVGRLLTLSKTAWFCADFHQLFLIFWTRLHVKCWDRMRIGRYVTLLRFLCNSSRSILILYCIVLLSKVLLFTEAVDILVDLGDSFQLLRLTCLIHLAWYSLHALSLCLFPRLLLSSAIWPWLILVCLVSPLFWNLITHQISVFIWARGFHLLLWIQSEGKLFAAFLILGSLR